MDVGGTRSLRLDLAAQPVDVCVHRAEVEIGALAPDLLDHLGPRDHPSRRGREQRQEVELGGGKGDRLAVAQHLVAAHVHDQSGELEASRSDLGLGRPLTAELGVDPRRELSDLEGLDDVVVGADLQPDHDVHGVGAGGDHHDRDLDTGGPEAPADVEPGEARQGQVEDDQVDVTGLGETHAVQAVLRKLDAEAVLLPEDGEDVMHRGVVIDDQHSRLGDPGAAAQ